MCYMWYPGRQISTHSNTSTEGCVTCGIQVDKYQQTEIEPNQIKLSENRKINKNYLAQFKQII